MMTENELRAAVDRDRQSRSGAEEDGCSSHQEGGHGEEEEHGGKGSRRRGGGGPGARGFVRIFSAIGGVVTGSSRRRRSWTFHSPLRCRHRASPVETGG